MTPQPSGVGNHIQYPRSDESKKNWPLGLRSWDRGQIITVTCSTAVSITYLSEVRIIQIAGAFRWP